MKGFIQTLSVIFGLGLIFCVGYAFWIAIRMVFDTDGLIAEGSNVFPHVLGVILLYALCHVCSTATERALKEYDRKK